MALRDHIESELGVPGDVFVVEGPTARFRILQIGGVPHVDAVTYVTEGISDSVLRQPSGRLVRQELVFVVRRSQASDATRRGLGTVAHQLLESGQAVIRGEVIDGQSPLVPGSSLSSLCCLAPALLPQSFWVYRGSDPPTMFIWLVPLSPVEAHLARRVGPDEFEGQLDDAQATVDLLDLNRPEFRPTGL